jgi:hypothetical protein
MVSQKNLTPPLKPRDYTPLVVLTTVTWAHMWNDSQWSIGS